MKHFPLSTRISFLVGVLAVLVLGVAAFTMDHMVDAEMGRRMDDGLLTQAQALESLLAIDRDDQHVAGAIRAHPALLSGAAVAWWSLRCGADRVASSDPPPPTIPAKWITDMRVEPTYANLRSAHGRLRAVWLRFAADAAADGDGRARGETAATASCRVIVMRPRAALDDALATIDGILLLTPLLALLAVLALAPLLVKRGLQPLAALGDKMRDIGPQTPGQRLQATGTRELEPLVSRFNEVLARMDEGVARERQFAGALAHETRTRLAELRALVEVERRYPSGRPVDELLADIGAIGGELEATVSSLLLLTRLQAGIEHVAPQNLRLDEVVDRQLASAAAQIRQRRLRLNRSASGHGSVVVADRALLDIIVGNLVTNAVAYAPEGSTVTVRVLPRALMIANDAPGVDADEVARFGQRFWSKHHDVNGHAGLGLALAGAAATAMNLTLCFTLDPEQQLRTTLSWPDGCEISPAG